jgi:hypothetical protein
MERVAPRVVIPRKGGTGGVQPSCKLRESGLDSRLRGNDGWVLVRDETAPVSPRAGPPNGRCGTRNDTGRRSALTVRVLPKMLTSTPFGSTPGEDTKVLVLNRRSRR